MVMTYLKNIWHATSSIFEGMAITLSWCFRRPYTVQWPDKIERSVEDALPERFRGLLEVDLRLCSACLACEQACPIDCIRLEVDKNPETKERLIASFGIDSSKCMYCGICAENCPTKAIRHTSQFAATVSEQRNLCTEFVPPGQKYVPFKPKSELLEPITPGCIIAAQLRSKKYESEGR